MKHVKNFHLWLAESETHTDIAFGSSFDEMQGDLKDAFTDFSATLGIVKVDSVDGKIYKNHVDLNVRMDNGDEFQFYAKEGDINYKFVDPDGVKEKKKMSDYIDETPVAVALGLIRNWYKAKGKEDAENEENETEL